MELENHAYILIFYNKIKGKCNMKIKYRFVLKDCSMQISF